MTEILFYHLEQAPLERVLPQLLEKSLARGWNAVVEVGSTERAEALDGALWTWRDSSFLPHGMAGQETDSMQPVLLTTDERNPNGAQIRFFVDRAVPRSEGDYARIVYLFDGHDPEAVEEARGVWRVLSKQHECAYWQQQPDGQWHERK